MEKSVIFAKKNLKMNIQKVKNIINFKYNVPKNIAIVLHNRSNRDYH